MLGKPNEKALKLLEHWKKQRSEFIIKELEDDPSKSPLEASFDFLLCKIAEVDAVHWGQHELAEWKKDNLTDGKFDYERFNDR